VIFALLLLFVSVMLFLRPVPKMTTRASRRGEIFRMLTDARGDTFAYSYNLFLGIVLSLLIGFVSSILGIGGGLIHVPMMIQLLHFPAHVATATSHYVLTVTAGTATLVHIFSGSFDGGVMRTIAIALGVVVGAQIGAIFSVKLQGSFLVRLMAFGLAALGARLLATALI
jgi:uncharacterized membrane protein YfcA